MRKGQFVLLGVLLLILSVALNSFIGPSSNPTSYVKKIEKILNRKCEVVHNYFTSLEESDRDKISKIISNANEEGIILLAYKNDSLIFWSSNSIPVANTLDTALFKPKIVSLANSSYYVESFQQDSGVYIGLINMYNRYPYDNEFLHSGFNNSFRFPDSTGIQFTSEKGVPVYDGNAEYLFHIILPEKIENPLTQRIVALLFFFLGLIFLAYSVFLCFNRIEKSIRLRQYILMFVVLLILLRLAQLILLPGIGDFLLFDPFIYAESVFAPSLGDLLLNSLIVFFITVLIYRFIHFSLFPQKNRNGLNVQLLITYTVFFLLFFLHAHYFSHSLIFNSRITYRSNEIEKISIYSLIGIFINGLNYLSAGLILVRILRDTIEQTQILRLLQVFILSTVIIFIALFFFLHYPLDWISIVFFYLMTGLIGILIYRKTVLTGYTFQVLLVFIFSVYLLGYIIYKESLKESTIRSSLALSLANEHDPIAEYLFEGLSRDIEQDTSLIRRLNNPMVDINELISYMEKNYFTGFWSKYHMRITLCRPTDNVFIEMPDFQWVHCYGFFDTIIADIGLRLPDTRFIYLDNLTGKISYIGRFPFKLLEPSGEITLFIELDSKLTSDLLGYPELLLSEDFHKGRLLERYSYAKYYKGKLVTQSGDFSYSLSTNLFGRIDRDFQNMKLDGFSHLLYKPEKDNLIVLSLPTVKFFDLVVGFSYIFLFYYVGLMLIAIARNLNKSGFRILSNLRSKIQFAVVSILLISLILIAASTMWISIRNYRKSQDRILHEKIQSVLIELVHKLSYETMLTPYWHAANYDNLDQLLIKFSDVFYSDINLYDPHGDLLATSRYEIFDLDLQGGKMDPVAYDKLYSERRAQFIHRETIGKLSYLSAYVPFENAEGKLLAYLNLPYFTKEREFQSALTALIVTIINIYLILILITVVTSIFISDQITRPLELLQQRFRQLKIGKKYEQIQYRRKDEIGRLVEEYNHMVLELERSVELLARSERESAWREMAKQIAHEIKNPLTPMRLSIQQLHKLWKDKKEDFDKYLEGVSATLIEQIDNLSAIASEFSNFAKMPDIKPGDTDVVDVVRKCVRLFEGNNAYTISFTSSHEKLILKSDKEQLSRALINIVKNGIQSIPEDRKGKIQVELEKKDKELEIRVSDNGRGIPHELKPKMFMPNFTTKTSGMGLGLAIAKNIIDQLGGTIWFKTLPGKGTVFTMQFPL